MQQNEVKQDIVGRLIDKEWFFFDQVNNIGGRASCQDDFMTFRIMRSSQFETWDEEVLLSYERDLKQAEAAGRNPVELKYAYMMQETSPEYFERELAPFLPAIEEETKRIAEQIIEYEMAWYHKVREKYPYFTGLGRPEQESEDGRMTSVFVYLRGELYTYSTETLNRYLEMVKKKEKAGSNLIRETFENTAKKYGYRDLDTAEREGVHSASKIAAEGI